MKGVPAKGFRMTKKRKLALSQGLPINYYDNNSLGLVNKTQELVQPESKFTINQRFQFVGDMVKMLADGDQASVIVTGPGGLGKTYNVIKSLKDSGMKDISLAEEFEIGTRINLKKSFRIIKGYSSPKGLYRLLYENKDGVLVMDDCDSVLKDAVSVSILKAALDSYDKRIISWNADIRDEDLPRCFEFTGRVIFISNMPSIAMDQAIISRSMAVDLSMTAKQKVERMRYLIAQSDFMPDYTHVEKQDAIQFLDEICEKAKELTLRSLIQVTKIRRSNPRGNWKALAEYVVA